MMLCHQVDVGSTGDLEAQWERQAILTLSDFLLTGPPIFPTMKFHHSDGSRDQPSTEWVRPGMLNVLEGIGQLCFPMPATLPEDLTLSESSWNGSLDELDSKAGLQRSIQR